MSLESTMAVGTGFGQLFRSVGQVRSIASVVELVRATTRCRSPAWLYLRRFSSRFSIGNFENEFRGLDRMRYPKIKTPAFAYLTVSPSQIIRRIRESAKFVISLPPDLQRSARDSYAVALRIVFIVGMCSTLMAYIARLPVSFRHTRWCAVSQTICRSRINPWTNQSPPTLDPRNAPPRQTLGMPSVLSPPPSRPRSTAMKRKDRDQYLEQNTVERTWSCRKYLQVTSLLMVVWIWKAISSAVLLERTEGIQGRGTEYHGTTSHTSI
jgi:hypothetical protein